MASSVFIGWFGGIKVTSSGSSISFASSLLPSVDNTYDLGSASFQWRTAYLGTSLVVANSLSATASAVTSTVPILIANGTAAAPSLTGTGASSNTGGYLADDDKFAWTANGTYVFDFNSGRQVSLGSDVALGWRSGTNPNADAVDVSLSRGEENNLALAAGDSMSIGGAVGAATTSTKLIKKVTGIADNTATDVLTVTVPNANHAATIKLTILSSNGSTDAFESSRTAEGAVVVARTTGANAVAVAATLTLSAIATVAAGATHTLAYGVSAIVGAVGDPNTFTVQVTIDDSGNVGSNQAVILAELINAEATGVTIA